MGPNRALRRLSENAMNGQRGGDMTLEVRRSPEPEPEPEPEP